MTFQNKIAQSRIALPATMAYGLMVWLLCGAIANDWWLQLGCFAFSSYLMVQLNNVHALIRVYSRMVTCTFIALCCVMCFLFPSIQGAFTQLFIVAALLVLFTTYQDRQSTGRTYYAFLFWGLISLMYPQVLYLVPILWLLMTSIFLVSLSLRTWVASLLGLITPYWFYGCWLLWEGKIDVLVTHLSSLTCYQTIFDLSILSPSQQLSLSLIALLSAIGITHYIRKSSGDKIRTRIFFSCFIWLDIISFAAIMVQPQHYDLFIRLITVCTSALYGHFAALTRTRVTNITFFTLIALTLVLTLYNIVTWSI